jgi:uncharacterized membrane protein
VAFREPQAKIFSQWSASNCWSKIVISFLKLPDIFDFETGVIVIVVSVLMMFLFLVVATKAYIFVVIPFQDRYRRAKERRSKIKRSRVRDYLVV